MARPKKLENMSLAELSKMEAQIERLMAEKQSSERAAVREKIVSMAKDYGFDVRDLVGGKGKRGKGKQQPLDLAEEHRARIKRGGR